MTQICEYEVGKIKYIKIIRNSDLYKLMLETYKKNNNSIINIRHIMLF